MEGLRLLIETEPNGLLDFVHDDFVGVTVRWSKNYALQWYCVRSM